jgi:hypothetical protein
MSDIQLVELGTLSPGDWVRFIGGDIGIIRDKVTVPGYRQSYVEVPGDRYPVRITPLDAKVEHLPDHHP